MLFWKMQLLRCLRWHSCLEQPEAQYIQFLIIRSIVIFFEFIVIAEKKRITKESFQKFLEGQDRYKLDPSNDYEELAQEQNIVLANFRRKKLSQTGIRGSNGNIKYLTFDEASYLAKVSRSMINKWADKGKFTVIKVGSRVRIRRDEFEDWMEQRDLERSMQ